MKAPKFLISAAAAATVVGAIGIAYAQTNAGNTSAPSQTPATDSSMQKNPQAAPGTTNGMKSTGSSHMTTTPATGSTSMATDSSTTAAPAPAPRADRN